MDEELDRQTALERIRSRQKAPKSRNVKDLMADFQNL
jgi:hypothetical protein